MAETTGGEVVRPYPDRPVPRVSGELPLLGRAAELDRLDALLHDRAARTVVISGPLGIGRSRLLGETVSRAGRDGWRTVSVSGTSSAATIPLGALAPVVPVVEGSDRPDRFTLLQRGLLALRAHDTPLLVGVDDAHLLDPLSVTVLQQLVAAGDAVVVATVRSDRPVPGASAMVQRGDSVEPVELAPLAQEDVDRLMGAALGADAETRTAQRLGELTGGVPLFVREMLRSGLREGRLTAPGGLWRWEGPMVPGRRLHDLLLAELDGAGSEVRNAMDLLAQECPAAVTHLVDRVGHAAVATLERRDLVTVGADGHSVTAHPLYAAVLRPGAPGLTPPPAGPSGGGTADRAVAGDAGRDTDRDADANGDPDGLAHLELAETLRWQDRVDELASVLEESAPIVRSDHGRARLAMSRSLLARRRATAGPSASDPAASDPGVGAVGAALALLDGRPGRAVELGRAGAADPDPRWEGLRLAAVAGGLAGSGRGADATATAGRARAELDGVPQPTEALLAGLLLDDAEATRLRAAGRFLELEELVEDRHRRNLAAPDWAGDAVVAYQRGRVARDRGRLDAAVRWLTEAVTGTRRCDPLTLLPRCLAELAHVRALLGDPDAARELLDEVPAGTDPRDQDPVVAAARSWWLAATGRPVDGAEHAVRAALGARDRGDPVSETGLLHTAVRLDRPDHGRARLRELARVVEGELAGLHARHADAVADRSGDELDRVAEHYERIGARLMAADASAAAVPAHRGRADRRRAAHSATVAARLAAACDGAVTPALTRMNPPRLTPRERQVARLAADGASNADIAVDLLVSVRTVETHLAHVYAKTGVSTREELVEALPPLRPQEDP